MLVAADVQAITAEAMEGDDGADNNAPPPEPAPSKGRAGRPKHTSSIKDRQQRQQDKSKGSQQQVGRRLCGLRPLSCIVCTGQRLLGTTAALQARK
jgi:hypothetical protein